MSGRYKRKGGGKFVKIDGYVKRSAAWRALTPNDRCAYIEMKWRYDGFNNGRIGLGGRELARELGTSQMTALRSLGNLEKLGFVAKAKASGFNVKNRTATEWRLTEYKCDVTGAVASKDFMRWQAGEKTTAPPRKRTAPPRKHSGPEMEAKYA